MRRKRRLLVFCGLAAAAVVVVLLSIPRVTDVQSVPLAEITEETDPELYRSWQQLNSDLPDREVTPADEMQVVTVKSIWGSWECRILPCCVLTLRPVGTSGSSDWDAALTILSQWSEEPVWKNLFPLKAQDVSLTMVPGDNTRVTAPVSLLSGPEQWTESGTVEWEDAVNCVKHPQIAAQYSVSTHNSLLEPNQTETARFTWRYVLSLLGKELASYPEETVEQTYLTNVQ